MLRFRSVLTLAVAVGCTEPPPPLDIGSATLAAAPSALAGTPVEVTLRILDPAGQGMSGVGVRWSAAAGTLSATETTSENGWARVTWTPPTVPGSYSLSALVDRRITVPIAATVGGGPPARIELDGDSVHLTRVGFNEGKRVTMRSFDKYNNPTQNTLLVVQGSPLVFASVNSTDLRISSSGTAVRGSGEVLIKLPVDLDPAQPVLGRVKFGIDIRIMSVSLVGIDSANGIAVGESFPFSIVARDSGNSTVAATPADAGVTVTSANPAVVSVSPEGILTGVSPGSTTVTASVNGTSLPAHVDVLPAYDFGTLDTLYDVPQATLHTYVEAPKFAGTGRSVLFSQQTSGCCPQTTNVRWHKADGALEITRTFSGWRRTSIASPGSVMLSDPVAMFDAAGTQLWSKPYNGRVEGDATLIVVAGTGGVVGLSATGDSLWSFATPVHFLLPLVVAPARVYLLPGSSGSVTSIQALDRSGKPLWSRAGSDRPLVADEASRLYVGSTTAITALDSTGAQLWTANVPAVSPALQRVALGQGNALVTHGSNGTLYAFDRVTGQTRWTATLPNVQAIVAVGNRVIASNGIYLYAFDLATGQRLGRDVRKVGATALACTQAGLAIHSGLMSLAPTRAMMYSKCL